MQDPPNPASALGDRIAAMRRKRSISQGELARRLGVTAGAVGQYEMGLTTPRPSRLPAIAEALDVTVDWLLGGFAEHQRALDPAPAQRGPTPMPTDALAAKARALTGITDPAALMTAAFTALIERESARRLARLGGTEPNIAPTPRRRPARA